MAAKKPPERKAGVKPDAPKQPRPLSPKQGRFVTEYLKDQNGTQAAIRAGYSARTANEQAARLLAQVSVRTQVDERLAAIRQQVEQQTTITLARVVQELARIALFDPRKFFHENGSPKPITELDDETAAVLAGMDVLEEYRGSGEEREFVGYVKKYKLADKKGALDMLMKHLGGYKADNEQRPANPLAELLALIHGAGSGLPLKS